MESSFKVHSLGVNNTMTLGMILSKHLNDGHILIITGEMGVGKTYFVKGIIKDITLEDAKSPSITMVNTYRSRDFNILHIDLYRENALREILRSGLVDYFEKCLVIIERGELMQNLLIEYFQVIIKHIETSQNERELIFTYKGKKYLTIYNNLYSEINSMSIW